MLCKNRIDVLMIRSILIFREGKNMKILKCVLLLSTVIASRGYAAVSCKGSFGTLSYDIISDDSLGIHQIDVIENRKTIDKVSGNAVVQWTVLNDTPIKIMVNFVASSGNRIYAYGTSDGDYFLSHEGIGAWIPLSCEIVEGFN